MADTIDFHSLPFEERKALVCLYFRYSACGRCRWKCCNSQSPRHTGELASACARIHNNAKPIAPEDFIDNDIVRACSNRKRWTVVSAETFTLNQLMRNLEQLKGTLVSVTAQVHKLEREIEEFKVLSSHEEQDTIE